ncbi:MULTISPECIES: Flp family type IVb pilin [unclassified Caulobacter]|uniref:Flp family type IVb pilin n=1 Tax=unclassified Caulobacter TaxID=2648921 RepID=UPI0009DE2E35|nr:MULTISPECIES: Flp family type IVb pilin [unclassified Caulobacter]
MGEARQTRGLSDAAGRRSSGRLAARPALKTFWRDDSGATAVELGVLVALIALVIVGGMSALSGNMSKMFDKASTAIAGT